MTEAVELYQKVNRILQAPLTERQKATRELSDRLASERDRWLAHNRFFYDNDRQYMQFLVPYGQRVLELGCGEGQLLRALQTIAWSGRRSQPQDDQLGEGAFAGVRVLCRKCRGSPVAGQYCPAPSITSSSPTWSATSRTVAIHSRLYRTSAQRKLGW